MKSTRHNLLGLVNPVETQRHFNVNTMSYDVVRRRIDVEMTSCVYRKTVGSDSFLLEKLKL